MTGREVDWPAELERIAGESPDPGGSAAMRLRAAARAWRAERARKRPVSEFADGRFVRIDPDKPIGEPGTRGEGRGG